MNVEIGTEAPIFLFWEYLFQIFGILSLQCNIKYQQQQQVELPESDRWAASARTFSQLGELTRESDPSGSCYFCWHVVFIECTLDLTTRQKKSSDLSLKMYNISVTFQQGPPPPCRMRGRSPLTTRPTTWTGWSGRRWENRSTDKTR